MLSVTLICIFCDHLLCSSFPCFDVTHIAVRNTSVLQAAIGTARMVDKAPLRAPVSWPQKKGMCFNHFFLRWDPLNDSLNNLHVVLIWTSMWCWEKAKNHDLTMHGLPQTSSRSCVQKQVCRLVVTNFHLYFEAKASRIPRRNSPLSSELDDKLSCAQCANAQ